MKIYVDFDDCLCKSARYYVRLAAEMFNSRVAYEEFRFFDMAKTFSLNEEQFDRFMIRGHAPEVLLSLEETPGASSVISEWLADSHQVSVITGRPLLAVCKRFPSSASTNTAATTSSKTAISASTWRITAK